MPLVHSFFNPSLKGFSNDCVNHICQVLSGQLLSFSLHRWQSFHHLWILCGIIQHRLHLQALEVRNRDVLDVDLLQLPLSAGGQVSHVIDGHRVVTRKIGAAVMREEAIDFSLALEFGAKRCCINHNCLRLILILVAGSFMGWYLLLLLILHRYNYEFDFVCYYNYQFDKGYY